MATKPTKAQLKTIQDIIRPYRRKTASGKCIPVVSERSWSFAELDLKYEEEFIDLEQELTEAGVGDCVWMGLHFVAWHYM